jgi:3-methylcrotonyl-CoA carboxylase alpha subunit
MNYQLKIDDTVASLEIEAIDNCSADIISDNGNTHVTYNRISENQIYISCDGMGCNVFIHRNNGTKTIIIDGVPYYVEDVDTLSQKGNRKKAPGNTPQEVTPPMPSIVVKVLVQTGDAVTMGQGLVVVSAMKMETTLKAPYDGMVTGIHAEEGGKVMPGEILVDIKKNDDA